MTAVRRLALACTTALAAVLLAPATPAHAAYPSPNATYKGSYDVDGDDFEAYLTVKVGSDKKVVQKVTAKVTCPGKAKPVRISWKNMKIGSTGSWSQMKRNKKGFVAEIRGTFASKTEVTGELNFFQGQCVPYQYFGWLAVRK